MMRGMALPNLIVKTHKASRQKLRLKKQPGFDMKVFISSTHLDLKDYRQVAIEVVNRYKCAPLAMEFFAAQPGEPSRVCDNEVRDCDILIGIYAHRFGFVPDGQSKSITQQEYELAKQLGKPCLCLIVQEDFSWNPKHIENDKYAALQKFLGQIKKENTPAYFTTTTDFAIKLSASLHAELDKRNAVASNQQPATSNQQQATSNQRLIPIAPTPFIAHPYPLPPNFTGRQAEKAMLSNWLHNAREPVCVLEAIGGMGKTALSWVWLQEEILAKNAELDGVLWWSFYDEPFESFLESLFFYLIASEAKQSFAAQEGWLRRFAPRNDSTIERGALTDQLSLLQAILFNHRFLLVLDGFERALRGYSGRTAMYIQEPFDKLGDSDRHAELSQSGHAELSRSGDRRQREPVHPQAAAFLRRLAAGKTKTLVTTRLFPAPLEELAGVQHRPLTGLSSHDAVRFFRSEGLAGTRAEMERAAAIYGHHPLMLKLLSTAIKRQREKDIAAAFKLKLIDQEQPQKILTTSFNLLNKEEQQAATTVAVFRSGFDFAAAQALFPKINEERLWEILRGLQQLGFLFYDDSQAKFDFHPILRSFLYDHLTSRGQVHQQAVVYFKALPAPAKVVTLSDLDPVIEHYHHLIGAGKFDEAWELFRDRLHNPIYYQLANYNLYFELLRALFPEGEDKPPRLQKEADQAWMFAALANSYALSGQPAKAVPLFLRQIQIREQQDNKENLAIGLGNVAHMAQIYIGQLSAAAGHLRKRIALCQEIKDEFNEAIGHQNLGRVLAYQGRWQNNTMANPVVRGAGATAEGELAESTVYNTEHNDYQGLSLDSAYRAISFLLQARLARLIGTNHAAHAVAAGEQAGKALDFCEQKAKSRPNHRDFVRAYWLLGEALMQCVAANAALPKLAINFYDEPFQQKIASLPLQKNHAHNAVELCLSEALRRCRSVNMVNLEPDLLLAWARYQWVSHQYSVNSLSEVEETLKEAREIAGRVGYRLVLADIHLFCAEIMLAVGAHGRAPLLGLSLAEHLQKAKDYALDVSEFSHLYQSPNPHFYDGIPEAAMLKRGLTPQERIENGYWVAYQIAEALGKLQGAKENS